MEDNKNKKQEAHNKNADTGRGLTGDDSTYENSDEISRGFTAGSSNENKGPHIPDEESYSNSANMEDASSDAEYESDEISDDELSEDEDDFEGPRRS